MPEPRYLGNDALSEQAPPSSEKPIVSKNLSSQNTKDSSIGPAISQKLLKQSESIYKPKQLQQANPVISKDLRKIL
jgi:hypothetical protein